MAYVDSVGFHLVALIQICNLLNSSGWAVLFFAILQYSTHFLKNIHIKRSLSGPECCLKCVLKCNKSFNLMWQEEQ